MLLNVVVLPPYVTTSLCLKLYSQHFTILFCFYILLVKMPDIPLNLKHNMYKNKQTIECFFKSFFCAWNPIFLSTCSNYKNVTFLIIKLIPWQFNTCVTPVFSYLISIPDNTLSSIWSPVPTFLCFVSFCGPLSLTREFCWAWTWSYLLKPDKLTTKDNGSSSSPNLSCWKFTWEEKGIISPTWVSIEMSFLYKP